MTTIPTSNTSQLFLKSSETTVVLGIVQACNTYLETVSCTYCASILYDLTSLEDLTGVNLRLVQVDSKTRKVIEEIKSN